MKRIAALVLMLGLTCQVGAVVVENWEGAEWSPGTSPAANQNPNGDTVPAAKNGWSHFFAYDEGAIAINSGAGYLGTVGAEICDIGADFRHYSASIYKSIGTPVTSGSITHYALLKMEPSDNGWSALTMYGPNLGYRMYLTFNHQNGGGTIEAFNPSTNPSNEKVDFASPDVTTLGWFAAEMTLTFNPGADNTVTGRLRDVDDTALAYIGNWVDLGSLTGPTVAGSGYNGILYQGFYMGDWGNTGNPVPFAHIDHINDPIPEPAALVVLALGGLVAQLRRRR